MYRTEPPPLATWMLEHLTPVDRDQALAGDLLEVFHSGRSNGWYWRQVLSACAVAWFRNLRSRLPLLAFALTWSALAPAWAVIVERVYSSPQIAAVLRAQWPLAAATWTGLNAAFLWAGILIYMVAHRNLRKTVQPRRAVRAFLLAPTLFLPAYALTFILTNLLWYPGIGVNWRTLTLLSEIVDLRLWADAFRIPYLVAFTGALWSAIPQTVRTSEPQLKETPVAEFSMQTGTFAHISNLDTVSASRFLALTVGAGLINSMIASFLFCRLPEARTLNLVSVCTRAILDVTICALAGVTGSWFYWNNSSSPFRGRSPLPFSLLAITCTAAWVWIPCMVLFSEQISAMTAFVAMIGAAVLALGLESVARAVFAPSSQAASLWEYNNAGLFAESLYRPAVDLRGYGIAIAVYAAGWALASHSNYTAALLLAFSTFLFVWEKSARPDRPYEKRGEYRRSVLRLICVIFPAVLVTMWALLDGFNHRNPALAAQAAERSTSAGDKKQKKHGGSSRGLSGYESIILWPVSENRQIVAPLPAGINLLARGAKRPLVLRFTGAYWYFQPPDKQPGPRALQTHGTPLAASIHANNTSPLLMEAHQNLSASIRLAACREIQVAIQNRDNLSGPVAMAVLLADSSAPGKPAVYLGQQPLLTSGLPNASAGSVVEQQTLRFFVPAHADIRQFNAVTVMFFPETGSFRTAPQLAIDQFSLIPR